MRIVADKNIPLVSEAFSAHGELCLLEGRTLSPADVRDADVLLVRSVTRVNRALLDGSTVRFVGSATSGIDHIDAPYLQERGIEFVHTPGNNARSVAEYVISILSCLSASQSASLHGKVLAVIGYGNIGQRVVKLAETLGMVCLVNDPPLQTAQPHHARRFDSLDDVLSQADYVTLHTPLTREGDYPSYRLLDAKRLALLPAGACLINTARGGVVDGDALLAGLNKGRIQAVLDVWEGEPDISMDLLQRVALVSPHIAGYSLEGKLNATAGLHHALCHTYGLKSDWRAPLPQIELSTDLPAGDTATLLSVVLEEVSRLRQTDAQLRQLLELPAGERASAFDRQRRNYALRREFSAYLCRRPLGEDLRRQLLDLGFSLDQTG